MTPLAIALAIAVLALYETLTYAMFGDETYIVDEWEQETQ